MKNALIILGTILCIWTTSCYSARVASYPGFNYKPTNPNNIHVFNIPPTVPFEIIGEVEGTGRGKLTRKLAMDGMKKKAASIGGDAIVFVVNREIYDGTVATPSRANAFVYGNYIYYTYQPGMTVAVSKKHMIGLVIKWKTKK